jgi:4-diphosphocytidyl-2-C-methyl-D-erythritol kinase
MDRTPSSASTVSDPTRRLTPVVRLAPAKVNLTLAVVGRRPDGFHAIHSVMAPLALADRLSFAPAAGRRDTIHVSGADTGPEEHNLVLRAIAEARGAVGAGWAGGPGAPPTLAARLEKAIPVAAGLAGGSSNAAAAIDGALEAWGAELSPQERLAVAARLGSDVPFFLAGGIALVEGRGERVHLLTGVRGGGEAPAILLVTPPVQVATTAVFAAFDAQALPASAQTRMASEHLAAELERGLSARQLLDRAGVLASANELLAATAAVVPGIVAFRRALTRLLGRPVGQSGSGPTCWALYGRLEEAQETSTVVTQAVEDERLPALGKGRPFVAATTLPASPAPEKHAIPSEPVTIDRRSRP